MELHERVSVRLLVGDRRVGDADGGRSGRIRLAGMGAHGQGAGLRRRERVRHEVPLGFRAARGLGTATPSAVTGLGETGAGQGPLRPGRDRALPRGADRGTGSWAAGLGMPAALGAADLVRRRGRLPRRRRGTSLGTARRLRRRYLRRPGLRLEAGERPVELRHPPLPVRQVPTWSRLEAGVSPPHYARSTSPTSTPRCG